MNGGNGVLKGREDGEEKGGHVFHFEKDEKHCGCPENAYTLPSVS
jgi:hypothetical protein